MAVLKLADPDIAALATERGLTLDTLEDAGVELVTGDSPYAGWWRIPYPHLNGVWKYRYRNPDPSGKPKYKDEPGASFHLYNPARLGPGEDEVWFTEGEFDTLCLIELGIPAIGIHGVANVAADDKKEGRWLRAWNLLFEDTLCVTMFDNDEHGRQPGRVLAAQLNGVVFDEWDDRFGDVNDWMLGDRDGLARSVYRFSDRVRGSRGMVKGR